VFPDSKERRRRQGSEAEWTFEGTFTLSHIGNDQGTVVASSSRRKEWTESQECVPKVQFSGAFEYASVLRPFADRNSPLYVPDFWGRVRAEPSLDPKLAATLDQQLASIRAGTEMLIKFNTKRMDAEAIYHLVADGELFGDDERAAKTLKAFSIGPARQLLRFTARNYMANLGALLPLIYDALRPLLDLHPPEVLPVYRCIYCLSTDATFTSEDHPLPESLAGETIVLPRGAPWQNQHPS
jgi:hypothetical protein